MRLGTSGLGVIAVVSLLVTAAPERNDSGGNNREREFDRSSSAIGGISRAYYSWPVRVASVTSRINHSRISFIKIEHERRDIPSKTESSSFPPSGPLRPSGVRHDDRNTETPATISRNPIDLPTRTSTLARNFKRPTNPTDDWSTGYSVESFVRNPRYTVRTHPSVTVVTSPQDFDEKFVVTLDSPISNFITGASMPRSSPRRDRRAERGTIKRDGETKSRDGYDDEGSMGKENEATRKTRTRRSSTAESAITMSHRLTTMTSTTNRTIASERRFLNVDFHNATERYESWTARISPEFSSNKGTANVGKTRSVNGRVNPIFKSTTGTISFEAKNPLYTDYSHPTNYPVSHEPNVHLSILNDAPPGWLTNDREYRGVKLDSGDSLIDKSTSHSVKGNLPIVKGANGLRQDSLVRDSVTARDKLSSPRFFADLTVRKNASTLQDSNVTEKIPRARQITREIPFPEVPIIGTGPLNGLGGNIGNTSGVDINASLDNHKAIRARSFEPTSTKHQSHEDSGSSSLPSRLPDHLAAGDSALGVKYASVLANRTELPSITANQITLAKSAHSNAKNNTKQSINLLDGKSNKIFYEIKPSLITDMDRGDDVDITTTTRRSFEKFLLPSVPSAFGKFGPYFLDEEDRRNVTERIGNTVQLDCRIGLLGHRKVTWLQHYKDSFRLLTVERESYSFDRRISLNFQYPDNWRLQIAYASMRDSGLYKCQVEIDQDRSLVKRYNVIITAPILTITDDSGRPVSGERHLKAGSALKLRCEARDVVQRLNESVLWMRGDETLTDDVSENRTTEILNEKEVTVVISTLLVERAIPRHAGNYSCVVPEKARTTIAVHVLNGELPAAVQHGSGVSTAVLNIWLVHLTASYGFFR